MKQYGEEEEEETQDFDQVREEEGMPDLEEEEQKEEEKEQPEQDGVIQDVEETAPQISEDKAEEKVAEVSESKAENSPDKDEEEEKPSVVVTVAKELDMENDHKAKEKKELAVLTVVKGRNLKQVVRHIDDHFARAYDSGKDVSGMLETQMVYHYLNVLDLKDSSKVFNAITWYWSRKTSLAMRDAYEDSGDIPECGMAGSHASTLERLYAWEKKLYEEVKTGEVIRMAFDRKCRQLSILDRKGEDPTVIDKTRAAIKKLDTRLIVAFRAIHSASMRIQQLTNEELYPQLAELSGGLMNMWKVMLECHKTQKAIALEMQTLENSKAGDAADEMHRKATIELAHELEKWQNHFHRWISSQRKYINSLFKWLEQCRSQPEADVKGALDSMYQSAGEPKIYLLIQNWRSSLDQLENKQRAVDVISDFAAVVYSLESGQSEELNLKKQAERSAKGLHDKTLSLQHMERRFVEAPEDSSGKPGERHKSSLQERRADLDSLRTVVEEEKHKYSRAVQGRRETTLSSLRENLPMVFDSMASFATAAAGEYEKLQQETENSKSPLEDNDEMHDNLEE